MSRPRANAGANLAKSASGKLYKMENVTIKDYKLFDNKLINSSSSRASTTESSTSSSKEKNKYLKKTWFNILMKMLLDSWKTIIGCICLITASYFGYQGYLETRVNTPFDNQKMVKESFDDTELYWGSYRPQNYFGLKTRHPYSPVMGLMWYIPSNLGYGGKGIRHWCEMDDELNKYGWIYHDGRNFGIQEINDLPLQIKTSFVKYLHNKQFGGDWTARVSIRNISKVWDKTISLIWYVVLDEKTNGHIKYVSDENSIETAIFGKTPELGKFQLSFHTMKGRLLHKSYLRTTAPLLSKIKENIYTHFKVFTNKKGQRFIGLPGEIISHNNNLMVDSNFVAVQFVAEMDFTLDISYHQSVENFPIEPIAETSVGIKFTNSLREHVKRFDIRFENTFNLKMKGFSSEEINFAKYALSSMLGGIGYFYGSSKVQSIYTSGPVPYWKSALYTAVPSRSFFPRGFLWDEGFHGLLISSWDIDIELNIMCHWLDLLNIEGWIPREVILGVEALKKVPEEFITQYNSNANPPTFFLVLDKIMKEHKRKLLTKRHLNILDRFYPRLQSWFAWYNNTQKGEILGTYRWRGRSDDSSKELNPKTLTSGLDDFPRASHPTIRERHIDIRCWIAFAANVMAKLSNLLGKNDVKYYETARFLSHNELLNAQHLSPFTENYADWGLHTDSVVLKKPQLTQKQLKHVDKEQLEMLRITLVEPDYKYVDSTFGYVNIFPFLLEILNHDSYYLGKLLENIRNPQILWTKYGLRSLSKSSPLYQKRNTEHDPPYWRGAIWINMNYLALKALRHYGKIAGPYTTLSQEIYSELRENLIRNLIKEYKRTGYLWEQYDDMTGHGKGCFPFTGWSSLIVLIMAEQY